MSTAPAEAAAQELARLREMFQQAPNPMALLRGPEHRFEMANPAYLRLVGHREVVGRTVAEALPEAVEQGFLERLDQVFRTGEALVGNEVPVTLRHPADGSTELRVLDFVYQPVRDAQGQVTGIFVDVADVTARVRAQEQLAQQHRIHEQAQRDTEEMIRLAMRGGRMGAWARDLVEERVQWTPDLEALFGLAPGSFGGSERAFLELVHPDDRPRVEQAVARAVAAGSDYQVEFRFRHASGEWRWMEGRGQAVYDEQGRPRRLHGIGIDITERRRADQALRRTELRLSRLFETNLLGVLYFDLHGGVQDANDEFLRIVGYDRDDLHGGRIDWSRMTPDEFQAQDARAVAELRQAGVHAPVEKQYLRKDGSRIWVLVGSAMVEGQHGVGFVLDLSGVKAADAALREADRRKDEFLATLAHELRNPLAPIRSAVQIMALLPAADPQLRRVGEIIERQVRHMVHLVDDLLDVSRITLGQVHLRNEEIPLRAVLEEALESVRPAAEAAGHHLAVELPGEELWLMGDATRVSQVFQNLLNNAIKYTPRGGRVALRVTHDDGIASVSVSDSGVGIPRELQTRIFELFTRAHPQEELKTSGLGIGLALAKQLAELHGGRIEVHSEGPGRGSEFIVKLPLLATRPASLAGASRTAQVPSSAAGRRVLVVDDNRDAADSLAMLLANAGCAVETVYEGAAALLALERFGPEVVLLDIGMPMMDGYEVARRIRASPQGRDVLLVALTGWGQDEDRRRASAAGFDEHLVKPVEPARLTALLGNRRPAARLRG